MTNSTRALEVETEFSVGSDDATAPNNHNGVRETLPAVFLSADETPISISQAIQHLKSAGALNNVVQLIVQQHLIQKELRDRQDLAPNADELEDGVVEYRAAQRLVDRADFERWLDAEKLDRARFHDRVRDRLKLAKLKQQVTEANLQEYFIAQKVFLDEVVLSRIVVRSQSLAEELRFQIQESGNFEQIAQEFSITEERVTNGLIGRVSRGQLPDTLRSHVDVAQPGEVVGPIQANNLWYLIRVERFLPAALTDELKQQLQEQLFEQWLADKFQQVNIQLAVD